MGGIFNLPELYSDQIPPALGTRMNTDYQDIKSYKKPNICGNLCPNLKL